MYIPTPCGAAQSGGSCSEGETRRARASCRLETHPLKAIKRGWADATKLEAGPPKIVVDAGEKQQSILIRADDLAAGAGGQFLVNAQLRPWHQGEDTARVNDADRRVGAVLGVRPRLDRIFQEVHRTVREREVAPPGWKLDALQTTSHCIQMNRAPSFFTFRNGFIG